MARTNALCLAFCALASTASAQIPVTDPAVLARVTLAVLFSNDEIREHRKTNTIMTLMAAKGPDQSKYRTPTIAAGRHQAGKYLYGGQLLHGLNAGDRVGELWMASGYPLLSSVKALARLTPDQRRRAIAQLASIDIADSIGQRGVHQVALARGFDAETARAIENLDSDIMNPRTALHYMTAVVDKLSAGALIGRRQQAVSNQLTSHILEQLLAETKRRRDGNTEVANMDIMRALYGRESARMLTKGMTRDLTTWRLP